MGRTQPLVQNVEKNMQVMWKFLLIILVGYVLLLLIVFIFQRKFLYFPDQRQISEASAEAMGLRYWPSPENFHATPTPNGVLRESTGRDRVCGSGRLEEL